MWKDFKAFAMRGNVVDLAVGVIIGTAFGAIVSSLVTDIIMPPIGLILGGIDFSDFYIALKGEHLPTLAQAKAAGVPTLNYGVFLNQVMHFLIVAFAVFMLVRQMSKLQKKEDAKPVPPSAEVVLLTEIRDLLKTSK
jgi:large conductance mechanosensitive channel